MKRHAIFSSPTTLIAVAALAALCACTPGGAALSSGGGMPPAGHVTTIDVNLTLHAPVQTPAGLSGGFAPAVTNVSVGDAIRFVNSDGTGIVHTATFIGAATSFPAGSPFTIAAQTQSGSQLSQGWSSGSLAPGSASQTIVVDRAGTYLYGCFYHYGSPMRGEIVAQ